jgi:hypothetical protein
MLVIGVDPASDPALAVRAAQLCSVRHRNRLAGWVERMTREADAGRPPGISAAVPVVREQVTEARESLHLLANALRHADQVQPRGIAMVERLLSNPESVIYTDSSRGAVELQVQTALDYLTGEDASARSSASATPPGLPRRTQIA